MEPWTCVSGLLCIIGDPNSIQCKPFFAGLSSLATRAKQFILKWAITFPSLVQQQRRFFWYHRLIIDQSAVQPFVHKMVRFFSSIVATRKLIWTTPVSAENSWLITWIRCKYKVNTFNDTHIGLIGYRPHSPAQLRMLRCQCFRSNDLVSDKRRRPLP